MALSDLIGIPLVPPVMPQEDYGGEPHRSEPVDDDVPIWISKCPCPIYIPRDLLEDAPYLYKLARRAGPDSKSLQINLLGGTTRSVEDLIAFVKDGQCPSRTHLGPPISIEHLFEDHKLAVVTDARPFEQRLAILMHDSFREVLEIHDCSKRLAIQLELACSKTRWVEEGGSIFDDIYQQIKMHPPCKEAFLLLLRARSRGILPETALSTWNGELLAALFLNGYKHQSERTLRPEMTANTIKQRTHDWAI